MPSRRTKLFLVSCMAGVASLGSPSPAAAGNVSFSDVTDFAGVGYTHGDVVGETLIQFSVGGAAAGDYDRDGWPDLFAVSGDKGTNRLFRNLGDGRFEEVGTQARVAESGRRSSGPTFADYDGDGDLDLFVGAVDVGRSPTLFRNRGRMIGAFGHVVVVVQASRLPSCLSVFCRGAEGRKPLCRRDACTTT